MSKDDAMFYMMVTAILGVFVGGIGLGVLCSSVSICFLTWTFGIFGFFAFFYKNWKNPQEDTRKRNGW